jgi:hypothetical protein
MATFWTGSALAADYGQNHIHALRESTRSRHRLGDEARSARSDAFANLNKAIRSAVQAQFDEPELYELIDDEGASMHCGCFECYASKASTTSLLVGLPGH